VITGVIAQMVYVGQGYRYRVRAAGADIWVHAPERVAEGSTASVIVRVKRSCFFQRCKPRTKRRSHEASYHAHHRRRDRLAVCLSPVSAQTTLNVATAGDQNMVDYVNNYLGPKFEKMNPGVKVRAVGTGPGDAGSQKIYEKLSAQQKAGNNAWDIDVAVIHQRGAATMVKESLLMPYRNDVAASKLVTRDTGRTRSAPTSMATCCRCSTVRSRSPTTPSSSSAAQIIRRIERMGEKESKQFGYNGVKGGMSGVGFVMGWVSAYSGLRRKARKGPVRSGAEGDDREVADRSSRISINTW
jgi:hypothetical protein